jgi:hypothetical protein
MTRLLLDIDGVILPTRNKDPFGHFKVKDWQGETRMINQEMRSRVIRLFNNFDVQWFSAWNERVRSLEKSLVLPKKEILSFDLKKNRPTTNLAISTLKLPTAINHFSTDQQLVWIDDEFNQDAFDWQKERNAATLLIKVDQFLGLTDKDLQAALDFRPKTKTKRR